MSNYLYQHYKGKYRVLAEYDWDTNDFPRDEQGNIDESFNDFYIPGRKNVKIVHAGQNLLGCYIFSITLGRNILANIYEMECNKTSPKKADKIGELLISENIIEDLTIYDGEMMFIFKAKHLDDWAKIFKLKTSGANISPLSTKNLPKSDYIINKSDEEAYNILFDNLNKTQKMQVAKRATATITNKFTKKQRAEMKQLCMKPKQYIHYIGKWDKLLDAVRKEINNVN